MRARTKALVVAFAAFLIFLISLVPLAAAIGNITLTPNAQAPGATVSISGTGFPAGKNVAVMFGSEIKVVSESFMPVSTSTTSREYNFTHGPIKPGSFHMHFVLASTGSTSDASDDGMGNILNDVTQLSLGTMDYALGRFSYSSATPPAAYEWTASFTFYESNLTSYGRVITNGSGAFSGNVTVPAVANGNYNVTVIDAGGTVAVATLNVNNAIPEGLPFGAMLLLASVAVAASSWHFRKRPRIVK